MVPHFRNSIPHELLDDQSAHSGLSAPQTSFSSVEEIVATPPSSYDQRDRRSQNPSRASSIHDLLNPVAFSDDNSAKSSAIANDENDEPAASALCTAKAGQGDGRDPYPQLRKDDARIRCKNSLVLAELTATMEPGSGEASGELDSEKSCVNNQEDSTLLAKSRKRPFDEIERLAPSLSRGSGVRLSMTVDGAVKVRTTDEETPSPPKQRSRGTLPKEGLRRSSSAAAVCELRKEGKRSARPGNSMFGRSRDARTWEFYCDGDAREALSAQAENENRGSAVGAIKLIRSHSHNAKTKAQQQARASALQPKAGGGNTRKRAIPADLKPKLVRAKSSMAQLPSGSKVAAAENGKSRSAINGSPSGDSDKENWAPGTTSSNHPLRRMQSLGNASRGILQAHDLVPTSTKTPRQQMRGSEKEDQENVSLKDCEEDVEDFMRGGEKGEDLDCVQGLLSLSQGAWR
jgi:hypothetical protein